MEAAVKALPGGYGEGRDRTDYLLESPRNSRRMMGDRLRCPLIEGM
jgi:hypothetical protein